jgi:hypothetical protein
MNVSLYRLKYNDKFYIGSTDQPLNKRLAQHRCHKKGELKKIEDWDNVTIELIESFECNTHEERWKRETDEINKYLGGALCMNRRRPYTTKEDKKKQQHKYKEQREKYREQNKEELNASRLVKVKCVCGKEISKTNMLRHQRKVCLGEVK